MTPTTSAILLQARMASQRLPGKVLAPIGNRTLLGHCLERLRASGAAPVVVVTTTRDEDLAIVTEARRYGVQVFRGPDKDVLRRFLIAADALDLEFLVRATADNPAVDIDAPARVLAAIEAERADHVIERGLPYGSAVEAVRVSALREAARAASEAADREHVTSYLHRYPERFRLHEPEAPAAVRRPDVRLTVDTAADLTFVRRLFKHLGDAPEPMALTNIIAASDELGGRAEAA